MEDYLSYRHRERDRTREGEDRRTISSLIETFEREGRRSVSRDREADSFREREKERDRDRDSFRDRERDSFRDRDRERENGVREKERGGGAREIGLRPERDGRRSVSPFPDRDRAISSDRNINGIRSPSPSYQDLADRRDDKRSPARTFRKESELEMERQDELERKIKSIEEAERLKREKRNEERLFLEKDSEKAIKSDPRPRKNSFDKDIKTGETESKPRDKEIKSYEKYCKPNDSKNTSKANHEDSYISSNNKDRKREVETKPAYRIEKDIGVKTERKVSEKDKMLKAKEEKENEVLRKTEERIRQIKTNISQLDRELEMIEYEKKKLKQKSYKISSEI